MKVLHVTQGVGGGVTRHIADIIGNTSGIEHHLIVAPPSITLGSGARYDQPLLNLMIQMGARIDHVQMRRAIGDVRNVWSVVQLRRAIRRIDPSLVHAHSSIAGALVRLANLPSTVPVVYTPHALTMSRTGRAVERLLGRLSSRMIAVSQSERVRMHDWHLVHPDRIVVIPNGIDVSPLEPGPEIRPLLGVPPEAPLVGTMMRLVPQKAPEEFIKVAAVIANARPEAHFLLIGMGPLQNVVDEEITRQKIAHRFHQWSHLEAASSVLDQLDVFVLPSRFEGGPYAPLEAIRAGTPVVLSDVVGNTDVVEHGVSGFLAPFGATEEMAAAVLKLLDNPALRMSIADAAGTRLREKFDVRAMGAAVERLYEEVASERTRRRTRRLPHPRSSTSTHTPDSRAAL